jgi:hypothetical protein
MPALFHKKHSHLLWQAWQAEVLSTTREPLDLTREAPATGKTRLRDRLRNIGAPSRLETRDGEIVDCLLLLASGLFDTAYYARNNPDVPGSGPGPVRHYRAHGGAEGRVPSPGFDGKLYLSVYPDIRDAGVNPLLHFIKWGVQEGRMDAVQLDRPPTGANRLNNPGDVGDETSAVWAQLTATLQGRALSRSDPSLVELRDCSQIAWRSLHEALEKSMRELEQVQLSLYIKTADYERSISSNDKIMHELATVHDALIAMERRASKSETLTEALRQTSDTLTEDLSDANREVAYWRRRALGQA